jgi:putative transposase
MTGNNPTDRRSKRGTKRHILTDKKGIPLSAIISSASTHDIKVVTYVVDNVVIKRPPSSKYRNGKGRIRTQQQHLCLDKGYNSEHEEQELIKRGYILHIPIKKKKKDSNNEKDVSRSILNVKKYSPIRGGL